MAAKKTVPRAAEGKVAYRTRTRRTKAVAKPETPGQPLGEVFWLAFRQLSEDDQRLFFTRVLADPEWFEDIADAIAVIEARGDPTITLEEFEEELRREGLA